MVALLFVCGVSESVLSQSVYKTPSGKKYHLTFRRMVENVSEKLTVDEATELGLEPCKICKPPSDAALPVAGKAKGQQSSVQCKALTKRGIRCQHITGIAGGYYY